MSPEEEYPEEWVRLAERDFIRVHRCLRDDDPEAAGFFLQQALERFLKGYLLSKGWRLRRIHDLEALLDDAQAYNPLLDQFRGLCQQVTGYYLIERYPLHGISAPSESEVQSALGQAEQLIQLIKQS